MRFLAGLCALALRSRAVRPDVRSGFERGSASSAGFAAADSFLLVRFLAGLHAVRPGERSGFERVSCAFSSASRSYVRAQFDLAR